MLDVLDVNQVLGIALALLVMHLVRYIARSRFWFGRVADNAQSKLDDPSVPIDNAEQAVEAALVEEQRAQVRAVARKLRPSMPPPTSEAVTPREIPIVRTPDSE